MGLRYLQLLRCSLVLSVAIIGCGDDEDVIPRFAVNVSDSLVFSWEGGAVSDVLVRPCEDGVDPSGSCADERRCDGQDLTWSASSDDVFVPTITSPLEFGVGGFASVPKDSLEEGRVYQVDVDRSGPCDPPEPGCGRILALGCAFFTP